MDETHSSAAGRKRPVEPRTTGDDGMVVLSYVLAGLIFYGGLGWLGDRHWGTAWLMPLGMFIGLGFSVYLIVKRYAPVGQISEKNDNQGDVK